jgi:hypothetical protein
MKFNANVEIASRQLLGTHRHFVHCAYLFRFSANSLPQIVLWSIKMNFPLELNLLKKKKLS